MSSWSFLTEPDLPDLMKFLCTREEYCTSFTERLLDGDRAVVPRAPDFLIVVRRDQSAQIDAAILHTRGGLYHPILGDNNATVERRGIDLLRRKSRRIYSIMGRTRDVRALEATLARSPKQELEYHLMAQETVPPDVPLPRIPEDLEIVRSRVSDASLLSSLQRDYEIEEVLLPGNVFDAAGSLRHLKHALSTQVVVHGLVNGRPIAKAGTNARGALYDQIGGVFTNVAYRSRGVATALMLRVLSLIAAENKSATLFVKMDNGPALTLYQNLGFRVLDGFRISYYR